MFSVSSKAVACSRALIRIVVTCALALSTHVGIAQTSPVFRLQTLTMKPPADAVRATALASADWTGDGVADLAVAYSTASNAGKIAIYPGNRDWYDQTDAQRPTEMSPFLDATQVFDIPLAPDRLLAGDFDGNGRPGLLAATIGANRLQLLPTDSTHRFAAMRTRTLPGAITAIANGELDRADGLSDIVLGIEGADGAQLIALASAQGAFDAPFEHQIVANVIGAIAVSHPERDGLGAIAFASDTTLTVLNGRNVFPADIAVDRTTFAARDVQQITLDDSVTAISAARSSASGVEQLQLLLKNGTVTFVEATASATKAISHALPAIPSTLDAPKIDKPAQTARTALRVATSRTAPNAFSTTDAVLPSFATAAMPLRLNRDAVDDLVLLGSDASVSVMLSVAAATFIVNSNADTDDGACAPSPGTCTLRDAINAANAATGSTISFSGLTAGQNHIAVVNGSLPFLNVPMTIDGTTAADGRVELDGSGAGAAVNGLQVNGGTTTIRGLAINQFSYSGIALSNSGGNIVENNFIGTDITGTQARANIGNGILIAGTASNTIGGTTAAARNVISGNFYPAVAIIDASATGNIVEGNYIGVDVTGTALLSNSTDNVQLANGASNNTIGGTAVGAGNVISGNGNAGNPNIAITGIPAADPDPGTPATGNLLQGNRIGTNAAGTASLGNLSVGVFIANNSPGNTVGGNSAAASNVIAGSGLDGVRIGSASSAGNIVAGNRIGTDAGGTANFANAGHGVYLTVFPTGTTIGGTGAAANVIAFNGQDGIFINSGTGNSILANSIFGNTSLGIDLCANFDSVNQVCTDATAVTANDSGDADSGANQLQNFPTIGTAVTTASAFVVSATLNSTASTQFTIRWFGNDQCDASGYGEGQRYIGQQTTTTNASGTVSFGNSFGLGVASGTFVTATATDPQGNTSEFSQCAPVLPDRIFGNGFDS